MGRQSGDMYTRFQATLTTTQPRTRVGERQEGDCCALAARAPSAPNSVRVLLDGVGHVIVDHEGHVGHVYAAAGNV